MHIYWKTSYITINTPKQMYLTELRIFILFCSSVSCILHQKRHPKNAFIDKKYVIMHLLIKKVGLTFVVHPPVIFRKITGPKCPTLHHSSHLFPKPS